MNRGLIVAVVIAAVAFILVGIAMNFGPTMLEGFEAMRTAGNVSQYTGLSTVVAFGPTMIVLGFIIMVGVAGFLGIKIAASKN
jgi:ABC-type antimicrobial peptide transport system permease subunit